MVVLRAIGGFFVRIGRWIKETAWIQPLLIVGAIFGVIFAIPHIIDGVKGWFSETNNASRYFAQKEMKLDGANEGKSQVDKFFTYLEDNKVDEIKKEYGERFFVAYIKDDADSVKDLYGGFKTFQTKWSKKDQEFVGINKDELAGEFKLYAIYTDSTKTIDNEEVNLFDKAWLNHYELFETMSTGGYLDTTYYAQNNSYKSSKYESNFTGEKESTCPMTTPLVMYFDFSEANPFKENQKVPGLSDVIFSVEGSSDLERARTLKNCWAHTEKFGKIIENN